MKSFTEYKYDYGSPESVKLMKKVTPGQNEAIVDPRDLRGRPRKADSHPDSPYGRKHPLHPANLAKKKNNKKTKTEATWPDEMPNEELDEAMKQTHIVINPQGKVIGYATDEKGAKSLAKNNIRKENGAVVKLKTPISNKKAQDMMGGNLTRDMLNKLREEDEKDPSEYDEEGLMMKDQLDIVMDAADEIYDIVSDNENLPEWCQNKITKAADYIDSVRDYLKSQKTTSEGSGPSMADLQKRANITRPDQNKLLKIRQMLDKEKTNFNKNKIKSK